MPTGTVSWFNETKGFGIIVGDDKTSVSVHYSDIEGEGYRTLDEGETVKYEVTMGPKGPRAQNVVRVS